MGFADDIINEFLAANPDGAKGQWSEQELNHRLNNFMLMRNRQSVPDFEGLSAEQMHILLSNPLSHVSVIQRHSTIPDEIFDQIPFFRLMDTFNDILSLGKLKLTSKGNLPLSVCRELYDRKFLVDDGIERGYSKKISEDNVTFIQALKACCLVSPNIKKRRNTLSLTATGQKLLAKEKRERFWQLFEVFTSRFNWAYLDGHDAEIGQFGWLYSIFLLQKYGAVYRETEFYSSKVIRAFPQLKQQVPSQRMPEFSIEPSRIYRLRFVERFLEWFGLIECQRNPKDIVGNLPLLIRKSKTLDQLLKSSFPDIV